MAGGLVSLVDDGWHIVVGGWCGLQIMIYLVSDWCGYWLADDGYSSVWISDRCLVDK